MKIIIIFFVSSILFTSVLLYAEETYVPHWFKTTTNYWCSESITDDEFLNAIKQLVKEGIITLPPMDEKNNQPDTNQEFPLWISEPMCLWKDDIISDQELLQNIKYLIEQKILVLDHPVIAEEMIVRVGQGKSDFLNMINFDMDYYYVVTIKKYSPENIDRLQYEKHLTHIGDMKQAISSFDAILESHPDNIDALNGKGLVLFKMESYEEALSNFDKVLEIESDNIDALNGKGLVLFKMESYEEALSNFEQALLSDPTNLVVIFNKGFLFYNQVDYTNAIKLFENLLVIEPDNKEALYYAGAVSAQLEEYEKAQTHFENLLVIEPDNKEVQTIFQKINAYN